MKGQSQAQLLLRFMDGISKAAGACSAIIHDHQDPRFIVIRDKLEAVHKASSKIAVQASGIQVMHE
jgi:hypothetical protein